MSPSPVQVAWGIFRCGPIEWERSGIPPEDRSWFVDYTATALGIEAAVRGYALVRSFHYGERAGGWMGGQDLDSFAVALASLQVTSSLFGDLTQAIFTTDVDTDRLPLLERVAANSRLHLIVLPGDVYVHVDALPRRVPMDLE